MAEFKDGHSRKRQKDKVNSEGNQHGIQQQKGVIFKEKAKKMDNFGNDFVTLQFNMYRAMLCAFTEFGTDILKSGHKLLNNKGLSIDGEDVEIDCNPPANNCTFYRNKSKKI